MTSPQGSAQSSSQLAKPSHPVRSVVYCGTPDVAVAPLRRLYEAGFDIPLVLTGEDKRRGRGSRLSASPVKRAAQELGLAVSHDPSDLQTVAADLGVVVAYGRIIKTSTLTVLPMVNLHFSLLPRWRGAAPVERAILAGDEETGVCLMALAPALDTGDIYANEVVELDERMTLEALRSELIDLGSEMLVDALQNGLAEPQPQAGTPTYAAKMDPAEYELDYERSALELNRMVRLGSAWTTFRGKRLKVLSASVSSVETTASTPDGEPQSHAAEVGSFTEGVIATAEGRLLLERVQPEGKKPMPASDWLNGVQPKPGERFG